MKQIVYEYCTKVAFDISYLVGLEINDCREGLA